MSPSGFVALSPPFTHATFLLMGIAATSAALCFPWCHLSSMWYDLKVLGTSLTNKTEALDFGAPAIGTHSKRLRRRGFSTLKRTARSEAGSLASFSPTGEGNWLFEPPKCFVHFSHFFHQCSCMPLPSDGLSSFRPFPLTYRFPSRALLRFYSIQDVHRGLSLEELQRLHELIYSLFLMD